MKKLIWNKMIIYLTTIVLISLTILLFAKDITRIVSYQYPSEVREIANIKIVEDFVHGINPYSIATLNSSEPAVFYMYPFLNNIIASLIVTITGLSSALVLYCLNLLWTILTGILIFRIIYRYTQSTLFGVLGFYLTHSCFWRYTYVSAFSDGLGILLSVLIIYLIDSATNQLSKHTIYLIGIINVLLFYTKQYFVVIGFSIVIYLFLNCKKECIRYLLFTGMTGVLSLLVVNFFFPLYFTETLFFMQGSTGNPHLSHLLFQIIELLKMYWPVWTIIILLCLKLLFDIINHKDNLMTTLFFEKYPSFICINGIIMALLLLYFGTNTGATFTYFLQLLIPTLLIISIIGIYTMIDTIPRRNWMLPLQLITIFLLLNSGKTLQTPKLASTDLSNWEKTYMYLDTYNNGQILCSPDLANYCIQHNLYQYDYGQNQYIEEDMYQKWKRHHITRKRLI